MKYVGLDLHKKTTYGTVMRSDGTILRQGKFATTRDDLRDFLEGIDEARVAIESSGFCLPWVEFLEELGYEVFVAHPAKVRVIAEARIKTDKIDSVALAHLLRLDYLPCSYVPSSELRRLRGLVRHRVRLGRMRGQVKSRVRGELARRGIELEFNPFTLAGREELRHLEIKEIHDHLMVMESVEAAMRRVEEEIHLEVEDSREAGLLTTIPGVGEYTALLLLAEIGDIGRFPCAEKLCSYADLVPSVSQSGSMDRRGGITRTGNKLLRWALVEVVWMHLRSDTHLTKYYHRIARRRGKKKATMATARKMLHVIYAMLRDQRPFVYDHLGGAG